MRRALGIAFLSTAALTAALALIVGLTAPPAPIALEGVPPARQIAGGYHVHTDRSDGTGSVDNVAAAAARAGLGFVILTDHGDGTRQPDRPSYRHGVLIIDAVELGTTAGHLVALGLNDAAPYPLAGEPRDVIEDIHRLGGQAVAAHPDSPNAALRWRSQAPAFDGIEWLNADSEWRDETPWRLGATALRSLIRAPASVASLFGRPERSLERWEAALRRRPTFGLAALDAHANIPWRDHVEPRERAALTRPGYETMFRTVAQTVLLESDLSGNAERDASSLLGAIARGASFSIVRAFADPASLEFSAEQEGRRWPMGSRLVAGTEVRFRARVAEAPGARVTLVSGGRTVASGVGALEFAGPGLPGAYRVEAFLLGHDVPWILSNHIVLAGPEPAAPAVEAPPPTSALPLPATSDGWTIEREPTSVASVSNDGTAIRLDFRLAPGLPRGQYAAISTASPPDVGVDRIQFLARADRPMRVSVQVRLPGGGAGERWRRSVYVDTTERPMTVLLEEFEPADGPTSRRPVAARLQSVLFVVDTLNARPGAEGTLWVSGMALGARGPTSAP